MRSGTRVLTGCVLGIFLAAIEGTVVGTVMPTVVRDLGGLERYNWAFTVYMVAGAVTMPIWGKLADLHGARPHFVAGVLLFLTGSILAGMSQSMDWFIATRVVQGLGAGAMFSLPMTILGHHAPPERRGHMLGFAAGTWGVSALIGPPLGALIVALLDWRWVFYINIPFGLLAIYLIARHYHDPVIRDRRRRLDIPGALLIMVWTLAILIGAQAFREDRPLLGLPATTWAVAAVALLIAIPLLERRHAEPIIPLHLFRHRTYRIANAASFGFAFCVFSAIVYMPLLTTLHDPQDVARAGLSLVPASLGWTVGSFTGGRLITRIGARRLALTGALIGAPAFLLASGITPESSLWRIMPNMFPIGVGIGVASPALLITLQNRYGHTHMGVVTSGIAFWRHLGGTLGVTLLGLWVPTRGDAAITYGIQHAFLTASAILLAVALLVLRLPRSVLADADEAHDAALVGSAELGMPVRD